MADLAKDNVYVQRINVVIDHVCDHIEDSHKLEDLAEVAGFSPFHFHRIFKSVVGQTLGDFVQKVRLEKAAYWMSHGKQSTLTEVAHRCGFTSSSDFSRAFRRHYGCAPRDYGGPAPDSLPPRLLELRATADPGAYEVHVVRADPLHLAYVRVQNPMREGALPEGLDQLMAWAEPLGLASGQLVGFSDQDPYITPPERYRYDFGLVIPPDFPIERGAPVQRRTLPGGTQASLTYRGGMDAILSSGDYLFCHWLPRSKYEPADTPAMELYLEDPRTLNWETWAIEIRLPLRLCR